MAAFPGRLPKKGPLPFRYLFLLTFVFFILSTVVSLWIINKGIEPVLMDIAESETKRVANLVINSAIKQQIEEEEINMNDVIVIQHDTNGNIASINYNNAIVNRVVTKLVDRVEKNLKAASRGKFQELEISSVGVEDSESNEDGIIYYIPVGQATNNVLLGSLGPRVPVRFDIIGDVTPEVKKSIQPFGINNALVEISVRVEVNVQVIIPFSTKPIVVARDFPVAMQVIEGEVPNFYNNGNNVNPSFEVPTH
ncbi:Sporulation protein YunB [Anoxybacillus sp. P3H1B]|uniref:Sporulation protein YunB n=1 Tax=Anoxybacteroides rupiense TaxID=311460 RepID=A0ABD5IVP7_9BACL|nr:MULTISPECIES: sporulation protein YunB [Anoxybacillus]KXG09628.1 Sporulation protein YunB [Anoxybacillus sp. P3H1B]MBB3908921.1 sporulation protein YunB [Anoxybacillus rupiensis]MED5052402.1 sporulation protein YunB [Anoxybacillus rupiensis]OQM44304.1 sporulation protein YunB [Anoxybacillus sp. UARK-01]